MTTQKKNTERILDDSRDLIDDSKKLAEDLSDVYKSVRDQRALAEYYDRNPYMVLAGAAGIGYLLGGGLFTPFTRRMLKIGMKAMVIPVAASQIKNLTQSPSMSLDETPSEAQGE